MDYAEIRGYFKLSTRDTNSVETAHYTTTNFSFSGGFNRDECRPRALDLLASGRMFPNDSAIFIGPGGYPMYSPDNITLTLDGCRKICGPKQMFYWDIGPRLSTWLIPILLLISNVELSPLDKRRFMAIIHLLGDPIDSIWSLVHKIDAWERCHFLAGQYSPNSVLCSRRRRVIAAVFAGLEELEGPRLSSKMYFDRLVQYSNINEEMKFREWRRTATELVDGRTDEFFRTCLAILLYLYQVIAGFVKEVGGGNTSPPGGRIGTAMFISWLVPAVLLSNTVGGFTARRSCFDIMNRFTQRTLDLGCMPSSEHPILFESLHYDPDLTMNYFSSLGWSGAIYMFRPWKIRYLTSHSLSGTGSYRRRTSMILCASILPLWIAMTGGFIIIWYTLPNGLNCRHMWLIGIFLAWHISALFTWKVGSIEGVSRSRWHWILVKDTIIGISSVIVIFLSACGVFNSCYCWSGAFSYRGKAHVPLNAAEYYEHNDRTIYPIVVAICLSLQCIVFAVAAIFWWNGLKVMRWSEGARRDEWERARGIGGDSANDCCFCKDEKRHPVCSELWRKCTGTERRQTTHVCCPCLLPKDRRASKVDSNKFVVANNPIKTSQSVVTETEVDVNLD